MAKYEYEYASGKKVTFLAQNDEQAADMIKEIESDQSRLAEARAFFDSRKPKIKKDGVQL